MHDRTKLGRTLLRLHDTVRLQANTEVLGILACELYYSGANGLDESAGMTDGVSATARENLAQAIDSVAQMRRYSPTVGGQP